MKKLSNIESGVPNVFSDALSMLQPDVLPCFSLDSLHISSDLACLEKFWRKVD
jgi:hypothetical protein